MLISNPWAIEPLPELLKFLLYTPNASRLPPSNCILTHKLLVFQAKCGLHRESVCQATSRLLLLPGSSSFEKVIHRISLNNSLKVKASCPRFLNVSDSLSVISYHNRKTILLTHAKYSMEVVLLGHFFIVFYWLQFCFICALIGWHKRKTTSVLGQAWCGGGGHGRYSLQPDRPGLREILRWCK